MMQQKLKGSLLVSAKGRIVAFSGHAYLQQLFAADCYFINHVHLGDRIAILTFFDALRQKGSAKAVSLRIQHQGGLVGDCVLTPGLSRPDGGLELFIEMETGVCRAPALPGAGEGRLGADVPPLAAAAHEMRTPLNAIIGFSDFLLHGLDARFEHETQREYVALIKKSGEHLLEIITHMLGATQCRFSGADNLSSPGGHHDIDSIIRDCMAMMASLLRQRRITFTTVRTQGRHVAASDIEVRQIVINLLSNAIKYTGRDGRITLGTAVNNSNQVVISVADNGIGISRKQLSRIGTPFRRAKNAVESSVEGNGLGLALVYKIAAAYGGKVRIKSRRGKGTDVSVSLPLACAAGGQAQSGSVENFPHLIHMTETKNHNTAEVRNIDNGKKEKEARKSA